MSEIPVSAIFAILGGVFGVLASTVGTFLNASKKRHIKVKVGDKEFTTDKDFSVGDLQAIVTALHEASKRRGESPDDNAPKAKGDPEKAEVDRGKP